MRIAALIACAVVAAPLPAVAADHLVADPAAYAAAVKQAKPGDRIILRDGVWRDFQIVFTGRGTADKPITLTAQTPGGVILSGQSNLRIGGEHLVVSNLVFRDGWSPTKELIAFRRDSKTPASHTRLTGIVVDRFTNPDRRAEDIWVAIYGTDNRVDHSWFAGKGNGGVTLAVIRPKGQPGENRARIDHNFFGPRPPLGSNGGETIRVGTSDESLSDSKSLIENNWFEGCDGEVEIVSVKSGGNIIRGNHGNGNLVERNIFLGRGKASTGGIRVINRDQVVRHNYLEGVTGTGFLSAIAVMHGVPNSAINRYHQVANAVIEGNSIVDASRITFGAGADAERSAPPVSSRFTNNLIYTASGKDIVRVEGDASGIAMAGNVQSGPPPTGLTGFAQTDLKLIRAANGLLYPADPALAAIGAPRDLVMLKREDAGPAWYPKDAPASTSRTLDAAPGALAQAVAASGPGDTIRVAPGTHRVTAPIPVSHRLTVSGPRTAILTLSAAAASPTAERVALIRAPQSVSILNYRVSLSDVAVRDAGDVIATTPGTFAEDIDIRRSIFANVSGAVVAAAAETGSKGLYSAERITIADSDFTDVATIADVSRLGTDESTFGPWFAMTGNRVTGGGAVRLSGVQNVAISGNRFDRARGIAIANSVGAPVIRITANVFAATPEPAITRLYPQGTPDIVLADNQTEALR